MTTLAPLPSWRTFGRAIFARVLSEKELAAPWVRPGDEAFWLARSSRSLELVARAWKKRHPAGLPTIWVPDYFCAAALQPARGTSARFVFYPVNDRAEPDYPRCRAMADERVPDIFVFVHYFGEPGDVAEAAQFCRARGAWLVEDAAHVLLPVRGVGQHGDFVLYSPHKLLPIPDGAVVVVRSGGTFDPAQSKAMVDLMRADRGESGGNSLETDRLAARWLLKRCAQKCGLRSPSLQHRRFGEDPPGTDRIPGAMSRLARRLLTVLLPELRLERYARLRNVALWRHHLQSDSELLPVMSGGRAARVAPYAAVFSTREEATAEKTFGELVARDLPVTSWPDLAPEVREDAAAHAAAISLRRSRLFISVHSGAVPVRTLAGTVALPADLLRLEWRNCSEAEWNAFLGRAGASNLLQSWAYGEAKAIEGWRVKRAVFVRVDEPVAVCQILMKTYAGIVTVSRINRGPLFFALAGEQERAEAMRCLASLGNFWRGRILFVAPEIEEAPPAVLTLARLRYRPRRLQPWTTAWIDLVRETDEIRRAFDGKWRNALTSSEKQGLALEVGEGDELFAWMIDRYGEAMNEKRFSGISVDILARMRRVAETGSKPLVLRASRNSEPVAGVCIARHGDAATYLIGWNSPAGRAAKANQYLLWQAILCLKGTRHRWLDLGGIDEDGLPGVAEFKLGMNGRRSQLVGEYVKI